ncbi:hypothetical protein AR438_14265 [Chryseobacterium aquaticum]|uniref:Uncharacterized protein n=1 Tax=Chryseobacterium aquaticum TaxID=452084 RepID=A0A0Q3HQF6_9FLAO|nr:hypothetical protein [Chryseobacterium aquaticum]KQK24845.1 hypothetical protein AR438_14265 [Chryseobacterium aquaticum]
MNEIKFLLQNKSKICLNLFKTTFLLFIFVPNLLFSHSISIDQIDSNTQPINSQDGNSKYATTLQEKGVIHISGDAFIYIEDDKAEHVKLISIDKKDRKDSKSSKSVLKKETKKRITKKSQKAYKKPEIKNYISPLSDVFWIALHPNEHFAVINSNDRGDMLFPKITGTHGENIFQYDYKSKLNFFYPKDSCFWKYFISHTSRPPPSWS